MAPKNEILPIVDVNGNVVGSAERSRCHSDERLLHPVVHLHVINPNGEILLQHRAMSKKIQPGKWDTAVGGHIDFGESVETALKREVSEEIGLLSFIPEHVASYLFECEAEREYVNTYIAHVDNAFVPVREESDIDELRFFALKDVRELVNSGKTTPNFAQEFDTLILPYLSKYAK